MRMATRKKGTKRASRRPAQFYQNEHGTVKIGDTLEHIRQKGMSSTPMRLGSGSCVARNLDLPVWGDEVASPRLLVRKGAHTAAELRHIDRIKSADNRYPIVAYRESRTGRIFVIDGMHRLAKAWSKKRPRVRAYVLEETELRALMARR